MPQFWYACVRGYALNGPTCPQPVSWMKQCCGDRRESRQHGEERKDQQRQRNDRFPCFFGNRTDMRERRPQLRVTTAWTAEQSGFFLYRIRHRAVILTFPRDDISVNSVKSEDSQMYHACVFVTNLRVVLEEKKYMQLTVFRNSLSSNWRPQSACLLKISYDKWRSEEIEEIKEIKEIEN